MNSRFSIELRASYALNYLIYLQNAILNKRKIGSERRSKFPYLNIDDWHLAEGNFEGVFSEVFKVMSDKIALNPQIDHNGIGDTASHIYRELFKPVTEGLEGYHESWQSFNTWFGGYWGQYAIERQVDNDLITKIDAKLRPHFQTNRITILVLYDEPIWVHCELKTTSYVYVVSFHQLKHALDQTMERIIGSQHTG